ncbi:LIM and senescent cell antigen-like-containing domain protein 2 [Borealophlyctis nickersoniae]|nr:LIM and senescent cell antigen-like-containing domain protein 2 [Borealophlyctis nickersoniae]
MDMKWHPDHFTCDLCGKPLAGQTFVKRGGKPVCKVCNEKVKAKERQDALDSCERCKKPIPSTQLLRLHGQKFHAHHFTCPACKQTLTPACKEYEGKLYCLPDFEKITTRVCFACRRPIQGRSVTAMGKQYHPEHFVCSRCEKPFERSIYWEYEGKPYCEFHYHELTGDVCGHCHDPVTGKVVTALGRKWCELHFICMGCHGSLSEGKAQFLEVDTKPMCKRCFEALSFDVRKNLTKYFEIEKKLAAAAAKS